MAGRSLTLACHVAYHGARWCAQSWLENLDDKTADAIAFVLCLDTLSSGDEVVLYSSKKRTSPTAEHFFDAFEDVAGHAGVPLRFVQKKVRLGCPPKWRRTHDGAACGVVDSCVLFAPCWRRVAVR